MRVGLDGDAFCVGGVHNAFGDRHVLVKRVVGGVDHHRTVEAGLDAVVAGFFVAMVEVHREDGVGEISSAARMIASSIFLSVYFRAPLEIWMMNGACDWMQPRKSPSPVRRC